MSDHSQSTMTVLGRFVEGVRETARETTVFGAPVSSRETTVIPVARVNFFGSVGGGVSRAMMLGGDGAGGVGVARARPSGFIVLDGEGARFLPIRQPATKLALPLAAITAVAVTRIVTVSVREARRRRKIAARCAEKADTAQGCAES